MNILYAGPFESNGVYKGGIAVVVESVMKAYEATKIHNPRLIPFNTCPVKRKINQQGKINLENLRNTFRIYKNLNTKCKKIDVECIYFNSSAGVPLLKDLLILWMVKKAHACKTIVHIHFAEFDKVLPTNKVLKSLTLSILKRMDGVVFLSKETENLFVEAGLDKERTTTIYNFHDCCITQNELLDKIDRSKRRTVSNLIFLGSINGRKGILDLLVALENVDVPFSLHVCGVPNDDKSKNEYEKLRKRFNKGQIIDHGYITGKKKKDVLMKSDILILPSYAEGFPLVLLEGAATGCAIISTNVGAITEVFGNNNGEIIEPGNITQLSEAIEKLANSDLNEYILHNYELSKEFSLDTFLDRIIKFIDKIAKY